MFKIRMKKKDWKGRRLKYYVWVKKEKTKKDFHFILQSF